MDDDNNPPPDLTGWGNDLPNLNSDIQKRLDDVTIGDFYNNKENVEYDVIQLLHILKTKSPPLTDDELMQLQLFIAIPPVTGHNNTASFFSNCVHTVTDFTFLWHKAIVKCI
jgi:hypothetical protein